MKMKTTKPRHRIIAMFLTLNFLTTLVPINLIYASGGGPGSPEAASFEPVDATDMVNLATGDLSYVMPLLNVPSPEGGYPLALSYHAGIGLDQEASWVGLGWNINPGAINRSVSGVPDDWLETKKYTMLYNDIGVATSISLGGSAIINWVPVSTSLNYSSFKATGGETTYDFGIGGSVGPVDGYIGTNGIGLGISASFPIGKEMADGNTENYFNVNGNISLFQSFKGGGLSGDISLGVGKGPFGTGMTLNSNGNLSTSLSVGRINVMSGGGGNIGASIHREVSGFTLKIPVPFFPITSVDFSAQKTKFWAFDANYATYNGALYAGKVEDTYQNLIDPIQFGLDSYEALYEPDTSEQLKNPNFSSVNYDSYAVTAQGIGGTMAPKLLEEGTLILPRTTIRTQTSSNGQYQTFKTGTNYYKPYLASKNFSKSLDQRNVHFYFENEYTSYLKIGSSDWSLPQPFINYTNPTDFSTLDKMFNDDMQVDGKLYDSYNDINGRLKKGRFIETYTNEEIINTPSLIIAPMATGFDRTHAVVPSKGIGAFRVTALDGKTYHYSLPVYHKEKFNRVSNVGDDSEDKFFEQQQFSPYATHWLLTAVTGPDYIDKNGNNLADEQDYGYWVAFEYGKWSDGFAWRSPNSIYSHSDGNTNSYAWGVKEVYYLDRVKTRTHTALFIKDIREDNKSYATQISEGNNPKHYHVPFERGVLQAANNNYYSQGPHLDIELWHQDFWNYYSKSDFWFYAELAEQRSLRLDKIVLLKNSDAQNIQKHNNIDSNSSFAGRISAEARISIYSLHKGGSLYSKTEELVPDYSWHGEYYNNVLNTNDIDFDALTPQTLKTIGFDYDETYPLGRMVLLDNFELRGKLTLNAVTTSGKGGVELIPPYRFDYFSKDTTFEKDDIDDWGYYKNQAMMWSLDRITTPLGGVIEVTYENDRYVNEYASPTTYFEHGLEFKFGGTANGPKTLSFRNDPEVFEKYQVDFTDYFKEGETTEIDVLFWHYTNTKSNWIGDFATRNCLVEHVSSDLLVFSLPKRNQQWGRENENCTKKEWVFYDNEYGDVVNQTSGWHKRKDENSCERPGKGSYRAHYRVFAQMEPLSVAEGGGVRVREIEVASDTYHTKTVYRYTDSNDIETGVTSYAPSKRGRTIPYISELPNPMVIYENVTTERLDMNDNLIHKKTYQFNVPRPLQHTSDGVLVENAFEIEKLQGDNYLDVSLNNDAVDMEFSKYAVTDYSARIGRLERAIEYNSMGQQVYMVENAYLDDLSDIKQGVLQESFNSYKRLYDSPNKDKYFMTSSSKQKIPNVLSRTKVTTNSATFQQDMLRFDFFTGQVIQSQSLLSNGRALTTKVYPAYLKYPEMGSKVDDLGNKNMLAQEAMTVTEIQDANAKWKKIGAGITTWKPQTYQADWFEGEFPNEVHFIRNIDVWRKHKTFTWDGNTDANGYFTSYTGDDDGFDWSDPNAAQPSDWKQLSEITLYNTYSAPLEVRDINGNRTTTKMGYKDSKTILVSNAGYDEVFYSGAEDNDGQGNFGGDVRKSSALETSDAHTGSHALSISNGQKGYAVKVKHNEPQKKYKISLWTKNNNHADVRVNVGGNNIEYNPAEKVVAGDWVQLNFYADIPNSTQVYVTSANGDVVVDDFRVHPIYSSMTSYVYNQWDELTDILGPNNIAAKYEYDEAGRLLRIYSEVENVDGLLLGGFKKVREYAYAYKSSNDPYDVLQLNLGVEDFNASNTNVVANVYGGSGQFEYQWSVKYCNDSDPVDATVCPGNLQPDYGGWGPQNSMPITTDCAGTRAVYWCRARDLVTNEIIGHLGNHRRGDCNGGDNGGELPQPQNP